MSIRLRSFEYRIGRNPVVSGMKPRSFEYNYPRNPLTGMASSFPKLLINYLNRTLKFYLGNFKA